MAQMIRVTPVVGLPQFTGWSHVLEQTLDANSKFVLSFSVSGENASNIGRDIIETVLQMPPRSAQGLYESIEECLGLVQNQQSSLAIAAGVFRNSRSILSAYNSSIVLRRGQKVGKLLQAADSLQVVEGKYQLDDVFVFASQQAEEFLSQIEINFQRGYDSDGVITAIVPALHSLDDSSTSALAFIAITDEEPTIEAPIYSEFEIDIASQSEDATSDSVVTVEVETPADEPTAQFDADDRHLLQKSALPLTSKVTQLGLKLQPALKHSVNFVRRAAGSVLPLVKQVLRLFSKKTYVDTPSSRKMLRWLVLGAALLAVLIGVFVYWQRQVKLTEAAAQAAAAPFRDRLLQAQATAQHDPIAAREEVSTLMETVKAAQTDAVSLGEKKKSDELGLVLNEAQTLYQEISGREEVNQLPIFYDLRLVSSDFISTKAAISGNQAVFIDAEKKQAIVLDVTTKQVFQLSLEALIPIKSFSPLEENQLVLLANGLHVISLAEGSSPSEIINEGDSNRTATLTGTFGSYVYVFNPEKRNIYRYARADDSYSDPIGWLQDPLGVPFESVTSWAIDGDIWIGTQDGQLIRFASGKKQEFAIQGLPEVLTHALYLTTRENLENVYILEPENDRLVVLTKEGQFLREVKSTSLGAASSVLINEAGTKAYVVSGSTVFELDV